MQLLKGFEGKKQTIEVNGHKIDVTISIMWDYDEISIEGSFDFGDATENANYLKRFERGEIVNMVVSVVARAEGLEGIDTLGGCHILSNDFTNGINEIVLGYGMVDNAIDELKQNIVDTTKRLQKYVEEPSAKV